MVRLPLHFNYSTLYDIFTLKNFNLIYVVLYKAIFSSLWKISISFIQFCINHFFLFINTNVTHFYFLTPKQFPDEDKYFHRDTMTSWLLTKSREQFTCPWDREYNLPGITLVFQGPLGIVCYLKLMYNINSDVLVSILHMNKRTCNKLDWYMFSGFEIKRRGQDWEIWLDWTSSSLHLSP